MTIDQAFEVLRRMDFESVERFTAEEREAIVTLGVEVKMRGPELARVETFLRSIGVDPQSLVN